MEVPESSSVDTAKASSSASETEGGFISKFISRIKREINNLSYIEVVTHR